MQLLSRVTLAIIFVGLLASTLHSQDFFAGNQRPRFNLVSRIDGLPNNSVSSIVQDTRGFIWMGTQGGLVRYDGREFHTYSNRPFQRDSLPHNLVQTTYYDEDHDLVWVGTYNGLARYRPGGGGFESYHHESGNRNSLSNDVVIAVSRGPEGSLWAGTQDGLNRMNPDGTFDRVDAPHREIRDLHLDGNGTLWIASLGGLSRWDPEREQVVLVEVELPSPYVMAIDEIESGRLLLGTWGMDEYRGGLVVFEEDQGVVAEYQFSTNTLYTVLAASDGSFWAGSWGGGLFAVSSEGRVYEFTSETEDDLASPVIYSLHEDAAGIVWVGTNGGGLHHLSPRQRNYLLHHHDPRDPTSLPQGKINVLYRDRQGTLWAGIYSGGVAYYDEDADAWRSYRHDPQDPDSLANDIVVTIYEDSQDRLWIGSNGGLQLLDRGRGRFTDWHDIYPDAPLSGEIIYSMLEDQDGRFWVGTYRNGITRYDPETRETKVFRYDSDDPRSLSNDHIYDLLESRGGAIWVATNGGLSRYRRQSGDFDVFAYDPDNSEGLSNNTARTLYEDSVGRLWIGTVGGGLNRFLPQSETFTHIMAADGLTDNTIVGILEGDAGRIWLATQQGLSALDPTSGHVETLDERDGLRGSEFQSGVCRDKDGVLLFGGGHGITRIDSSVSTRNTHAPPVQITDVQVFQDSLEPHTISFNNRTLILGPGDSFVSFEFVGLDFEAPEHNLYSYRLEGLDEEWVFSGNRNFATYTNLAPGTYQFSVQVANADGVWTEDPASLQLVVTAPWYVRWWAIALYVGLGVLIVRTAFRVRDARILADKNRQLETAVTELERLSTHDSLTGLLNRRYYETHFQQAWDQAVRSERPICLFMADVDYFKEYNDTHGHPTADRALERVAQLMKAELPRSTDFVARFGGEEFAGVLYDTSLEGGVQVAERIRAAIEAHVGDEELPPVTISIGIAEARPTAGDDRNELLTTADTLLYRAKAAGRNRVEAQHE